MISLARGVPSQDMLPARQLAKAARRALDRDPLGALSYGEANGYPPLRTWFGRQLDVDPERIVLTNGSLQGLSLVAGHLATTGRHVIVEAPTYDFAMRILRRIGEVSAVRVDADGLDLDQLERVLERHGDSVLYTIPTFQNPTGTTMSEEKRGALLALAHRRDLLIIEDDPYRLLSIDAEPPSTLLSSDHHEHVIHLTSLTKTVAPGLRCGAMVLPWHLLSPIAEAARDTYIAPGHFAQATAAAFIESGAFEPCVDATRVTLRERRDAALRGLSGTPGVSWSPPGGGYFLWLQLAGGSARELGARAAQAGVQVLSGDGFFADGHADRHLRVAFCAAPTHEVREAITRLARLIAEPTRRAGETEHAIGDGDGIGRVHTLES